MVRRSYVIVWLRKSVVELNRSRLISLVICDDLWKCPEKITCGLNLWIALYEKAPGVRTIEKWLMKTLVKPEPSCT